MENFKLPFILFYTSALIFYLNDALIKKASNQLNAWQFILVRSVCTFVLSIIIIIPLVVANSFPDVFLLRQLMIASFFCGLGLFFFIKSVNSMSFANVGALSVLGNITQQLLAFFLLKETIKPVIWLSFLIICVGYVFQFKTHNREGLLWVLLCNIFWPLGYVLLSIPLKKMNALWSIPIMECTILSMSLVILFLSKTKIKKSDISGIRWNYLFSIALLTIIGSFLLNYTFKTEKISNITFLQMSMMIFTYFTSIKIFKENPSKYELISFGLLLGGFWMFLFEK
ncbi:MAG: EamA family transporter [Chryseobacterium sp.]